jgi:hypothetical protein
MRNKEINVFVNMDWQSPFLGKFVFEMYLLGLVALLLGAVYGIWVIGWQRFRSDPLGAVKYLLRNF